MSLSCCQRAIYLAAVHRQCTKSYLNHLSSPHGLPLRAATDAPQAGMGPRASALVAGFTQDHRQLEQELAALKGTQDALLFPTGGSQVVA
jgi:7-keto-8-aminopelargonate synthetase-like enzyme